MGSRADLSELLRQLVTPCPVFFQPKTNTKLTYPCIVYQRDPGRTAFADNVPYSFTQRYQLTVITTDPDSDIPAKVRGLPLTVHSAFFVADNLNHDVFEIYF